MVEEWEEIWGFSRYMVSTMGRVKSRGNGLILIPEPTTKGDLYIRLLDNGGRPVMKRLDRLVVDAFAWRPDYSPVYHRDNDKTNCRIDNLYCAGDPDIPVSGRIKGHTVDPFVRMTDGKKDIAPRPPRPHGKKPQRRVRVLETGQIFDSQAAAARAIDVTASAVGNMLRGRIATVKGYRFEYVDDTESRDSDPAPPINVWEKKRPKNSIRPHVYTPREGPRRVKVVETGRIYISQGAAALATGVQQATVSAYLRGLRKGPVRGLFTYVYAEDNEEEIENEVTENTGT